MASGRPAARRPGVVPRHALLQRGFCLLIAIAAAAGCQEISGEIPMGSTIKNDLESMRVATMTIVDRTSYQAYIARQTEEITVGLMNVTEDELPADHGMLFVFEFDAFRSFWMRNTIIPLDIAFIRSDGTIVKIHTMEPLTERGYSSVEPARFALEVRAGQFAEHGVREGDHVEIPTAVFNSSERPAEATP
ncbi:MAG: DUF192 domain-containing protein [Phycisphaerae bacterium]